MADQINIINVRVGAGDLCPMCKKGDNVSKVGDTWVHPRGECLAKSVWDQVFAQIANDAAKVVFGG
jgi:hypothetical protein